MGTQLILGLVMVFVSGQAVGAQPHRGDLAKTGNVAIGLSDRGVLSQPPAPPPMSNPTPREPDQALVRTKVAPSTAGPLPRCDARSYQRLVGRTVSDLLTMRVPPNTRIYRLDDPQTAPLQSGRLSVELNRSTRVRRVYCS